MYAAHSEDLNGFTLKIVPDSSGDIESPVEHDEAVIFAVLHRRFKNPAAKLASGKVLDSMGEAFDFTSTRGIEHFEEEMEIAGDKAAWVVFPLFMYDHGGTVYRASKGRKNPFLGILAQGHAEFDSGRVGIIALKKSAVGEPGKVIEREGAPPYTVPSYFDQAQSVCDTYSDWANGTIYGYVIETPEGDQIDSCWGFIGSPSGEVLTQGREQLKHFAATKKAN